MYCIAVSYAFVLNIGTSSHRKKLEKPFCQVGSRECQDDLHFCCSQVTTTVATEGGGIAGGGGAASSLPSASTGVFFHNLTNLRPTMTPIKVKH